MKLFPKILASLLGALLVSSAEAKLNVVATTWDFGAIAQEIGGDKINLAVLGKPTEDPHFVDAKPSYIVKLNRADALIEGGAELEVGWLPPLLEGARNTKLDVGKPGRILCSEGVHLLEVPSALDRSQGDIHAAGNPHFMSDPMNGKIAAEHIANAFCQLDPTSCDYFKANLKKFDDDLDAKMAEWQKMLAPYQGKQVVSYHNYWIYFAQRFGLPMDLYLEPKPGIPPTPAHLAEVITKMKAENIKVIVVQPYQNRKTAETVAGHTGAAVVDFPSFPSGSGETKTYLDWIDFLVKSVVKGFEEKKS
ncbi:MAG TPA: metal ABC transporter substrate-binding protein [Verrucomicrobiae bacterium]|jgi:zinc/manganese transport system substrate-binding protein|nr:metal ABC transporter substrate-binding protein [Verrucomicrobiae bacterium]